MQLVGEAVGDHCADERAAATDVEVADVVLQPADRLRVVWPEDLRVPPRRIRQRPGDDVLHGVVKEWRSGIVFDGPLRPGRFEHLVRRASEQDAGAAVHRGGDRFSHLRVVAVVERPRRRVNHTVEAHELVNPDRSHFAPPFRCYGFRRPRRHELIAPRASRAWVLLPAFPAVALSRVDLDPLSSTEGILVCVPAIQRPPSHGYRVSLGRLWTRDRGGDAPSGWIPGAKSSFRNEGTRSLTTNAVGIGR